MNMHRRAIIINFIGLMISSPVLAEPGFDYDLRKPMIFRSASNGGNCNGCSWIIAEGTIQADTPEEFQKFVSKQKIEPNEFIKLNSPGGNLLAGIKLGEMIRRVGLITGVGKTVGKQSPFDSNAVESSEFEPRNGICASACVYSFIGGTKRFASKAKIGIHQFYDSRALNDPLAKTANSIDRSTDQLLTGLLLEFVIRMGVDPRLVSVASSVAPWEEMKWLNASEITDLKIDNSEISFTPLDIEPFGNAGAFAETVSRSVYYSFRHRIYCKANSGDVYLAFLSNSKPIDVGITGSIGELLKKASVALIGDKAERIFPVRIAHLNASNDGTGSIQAAVNIVGASMQDVQSSTRIELRGELLSRYEGDIAYWLSFNLIGDRRKIAIAARSCVK